MPGFGGATHSDFSSESAQGTVSWVPVSFITSFLAVQAGTCSLLRCLTDLRSLILILPHQELLNPACPLPALGELLSTSCLPSDASSTVAMVSPHHSVTSPLRVRSGHRGPLSVRSQLFLPLSSTSKLQLPPALSSLPDPGVLNIFMASQILFSLSLITPYLFTCPANVENLPRCQLPLRSLSQCPATPSRDLA